MDILSLANMDTVSNVMPSAKNLSAAKGNQSDAFGAMLNAAIDNVKVTNAYLSDAENEELKFAMGETENTHDLAIALQKASTALQYTVAVRDRFLEAYRTIMQMQI